MKKTLLLVLLLAMDAAAVNCTTDIIVEENGNAAVFTVLAGEGTVNVPLPLDVPEPVVEGALYVISEDGIEVSLEGDDTAVVSYRSSILTSKEAGLWNFRFETPNAEYVETVLALPLEASLDSVQPKGLVSVGNDSRVISWSALESQTLTVSYDYDTAPGTSTTVPAVSTTLPIEAEGGLTMTSILYTAIFIILVLLALAAVVSAVLLKIKRKAPTEGMLKVMRTLTGNEYKVIDMVLKQKEQGMRRSELERACSISKSSLAVAITTLERKDIVDVDRTRTIHYIELSKWFKGL